MSQALFPSSQEVPPSSHDDRALAHDASSSQGEAAFTSDSIVTDGAPVPTHSLDWKRAHDALLELARRNARLDAEIGRWLLYAARAAAPVWLGYADMRHYAEHLFGFTPRQTQERLRVAEALEQLPALRDALEQGQLCWSVVRELTRTATAETEAEWLAATCHRTAREVEQMVRGHRPGDRPGDSVNGDALERVLRFELTPDVYATVQEALAKVRRDSGGRIDDAHALLVMARQVLAGPADPGRSSYQLAISMCPSCKRGFQLARGELIELGREAVEMACCDAQHIGDVDARAGERVHATHVGSVVPPVSETRTSPPEPPRATQTVPPRIRRQVLRRAGGRCEVPGCANCHFVDVHHCDPREEGGGHDPNRLIVCCGSHHKAVHDGRLSIQGNAGSGWTFQHADGTTYGGAPSPCQAEVSVKVFQALRSLGFKETACRSAVAEVRGQLQAHAGVHANGTAKLTQTLLREAVRVLTSPRQRIR